jgi:chloramphenicol O-acetyltransferase type B
LGATVVIKTSSVIVSQLREAGIECFLNPAQSLPSETTLEPPCSLKWMNVEHSLSLGAFSYAVSGYFFGVSIGRYTSIGEAVQIGRGDHPTTYLSTSPAFYLNDPLFSLGSGFSSSAEFKAWRPKLVPGARPTTFKPVKIGNDVYIGHGAFIRPGVTIGDGAIVGAQSVVLRDVPPYAVVAGNPAAIKKFRVPGRLIGALLALQWWRFAPWQLEAVDITNLEAALPELRRIIPQLEPYAPDKVIVKNLVVASQ